jgi:hypothetical protein
LRPTPALTARLPTILLAFALLAAACGGSGESEPTGAGSQSAWGAILEELGLTPDAGLLELGVAGAAPELEVTIAVPADGQELSFADGLYGVVAYSFADGTWTRVDTADVRTEIAPLLAPGESATVRLPVEEAPSYRVLVPVAGKAVWADSA